MTKQIPREDVERLRVATERLPVLADWIDLRHPEGDDEVQRDLREWAESLARVLSRIEEMEGQLALGDHLADMVLRFLTENIGYDEQSPCGFLIGETDKIAVSNALSTFRQARQEND